MQESWAKALESILLVSSAKGQRTLAFTSPAPRSGVSMVVSTVSELMAYAGYKTLLLDLTRAVNEDGGTSWSPVHPDQQQELEQNCAVRLDRLVAASSKEGQFAFSNVKAFKDALESSLSHYQRIIIDLPPVSSKGPKDQISPISAAAASDGVYLICKKGDTRRGELERTLEELRRADSRILGVLLSQPE